MFFELHSNVTNCASSFNKAIVNELRPIFAHISRTFAVGGKNSTVFSCSGYSFFIFPTINFTLLWIKNNFNFGGKDFDLMHLSNSLLEILFCMQYLISFSL